LIGWARKALKGLKGSKGDNVFDPRKKKWRGRRLG